jgi:cation:H+ antiporter
MPVLAAMTLMLVVFAWGRLGRGRINRVEGTVLLVVWAAYTTLVLVTAG